MAGNTLSLSASTYRRSVIALRRGPLALACLLAFAAPVFASDPPAKATLTSSSEGELPQRPKDPRHVINLDGVSATANVDGDSTYHYTIPAATGATRLPLSLRETPQSVSVVTRAQMDDFGMNNINDVLGRATGISVEKIETDRTYYGARGFDITNFLTDGLGMPFANGGQEGDIDTAIYDHIEVLRGANGLLSFTGNPSATINFVRKRPTADSQGSVGATVGSWNNRRLDADLSGALNASRSVRGRVVLADQQTDSYLDRYSMHKQIAAGMLEADLGADTTLSAGITRQKNSPDSPMWGALPLYNTDGTPTRYARSTSTAADWARWDLTNTQTYLTLSHEVGHGWSVKGALNYRRIANDSELFYVYGTPDVATGRGLFSYPSAYGSTEKQYYADLYASGPFALGGREHELVLGVNAGKSDVNQLSGYSSDIGTALPPLEGWDGRYPKPAFDAYYQGADFHVRRRSAYATARWNVADRLKLISGASLTYIRSTGTNYGVAHVYEKTKTTPFLGAVYDLDAHVSVYASYAKLFNPQTEVDIATRVLDPVSGDNLETGIKGAWMEDRLNASFAVFRSRQNHYAESVGINPATGQSYYRGIDAISTGYEFDLAGSLTPNWEASAGFTQLGIEDDQGRSVRTYVPRRVLRATTTYRLPWVPGLKVGGSLRWQDRIVRDQLALDTQGREIFTRQGSYTLLGVMARYDFDPSWSATLNVDNLTNRKYIASLYWAQGYYGAPTNWQLNVTYRF